MKKYTYPIILLVLLLSIFWSCEKDDICLEDTTPRLVIRFYDHENPNEFKKVTNLTVQIEGISEDYLNETISSSTDSIAIPIEVAKDITTFQLILNGSDNDETNDNTDVFDLNYTREDVFVSRSCGYKTIFHDGTTDLKSDEDNWIFQLETIESPQNISNQNAAHVKIFH